MAGDGGFRVKVGDDVFFIWELGNGVRPDPAFLLGEVGKVRLVCAVVCPDVVRVFS